MTEYHLPAGVALKGPIEDRFDEILTTEAMGFLADLHRSFNARRLELLAARADRQERIN